MIQTGPYRIVKLVNGAHSVHSLSEAETFHPVVGPQAEAEELYVRQLGLVKRIEAREEEFVVWDVGLGAAANPLTLLAALKSARVESNTGSARTVRIVSFDHTFEPLRFALENTTHLPYLQGFEEPLVTLLRTGEATFAAGEGLTVRWTAYQSDFPTLLQSPAATRWPKPDVIMFDAFSPAKNPAMWTLPVFQRIYELLDPRRPCALPTYSRGTILRVTLLLAGFYVGVGQPIGDKEETTVAANSLELLREPLPSTWLARARRSTSAEPMRAPVYRQAPLSDESWTALQAHPQFITARS